MKRSVLDGFLALLLSVLLIVPASARAASPQFFDDLGDVPVMPGLSELAERGVVFDKPEGRIAQATALAAEGMEAGAPARFYAEALPQFGWQSAGDGRYVREDQALSVTERREEGRILIIFRLEPR